MTSMSVILLLSALVVWILLIFAIVLFLKGANLYDREYFDDDKD